MKFKYFLVLITSFLLMNVVHANDIKSINMDIYVDNNGNAHIKEKWTIDVTSGTEVYKPYYNIENSNIIDYKVTLNNQEFTTIPNWNTNATFEEKSYKAGLHKIQDGYELCFGVTQFGLNTYEFDYTITNFVIEATDADIVYWTLIPNNLLDSPETTYIKIYSDFKYEDKIDVWGYGNYGGGTYVYDGYIEMRLDDNLKSDEYMAVLIKFPKETFSNNIKVYHNFDYYYERAEQNSSHYEKEENISNLDNKKTKNILKNILGLVLGIFIVLVIFSPIFIILIYHYLSNKIICGTKIIKFKKGVKKVKNVTYFRDIPCKNIFEAYWIACQFGLVKNKNDFLGVMLLKWLKDKNIEIVKNKKIKLKFNNDNKLLKDEKKLYDMMKKSSKNDILEEKEFSKWCYNNYFEIVEWFDNVFDKQTKKLYEEGKLTKVIERERFGKFFTDGKKEKEVYYVEEVMKKDGLKVAGLKNFLNDFSNIKDRKTIEIINWEEYLMYAQLFGIAKKVSKEFKDLYPETITDSLYDDIVTIYNFSYIGVSSINNFKSTSLSSPVSRNNSYDRSDIYSSGGGGYSSGGGADDSFGKGAGGGGVR